MIDRICDRTSPFSGPRARRDRSDTKSLATRQTQELAIRLTSSDAHPHRQLESSSPLWEIQRNDSLHGRNGSCPQNGTRIQDPMSDSVDTIACRNDCRHRGAVEEHSSSGGLSRSGLDGLKRSGLPLFQPWHHRHLIGSGLSMSQLSSGFCAASSRLVPF